MATFLAVLLIVKTFRSLYGLLVCGLNFDLVFFPFLDGDVPRRASYCENISQLIRFASLRTSTREINSAPRDLHRRAAY